MVSGAGFSVHNTHKLLICVNCSVQMSAGKMAAQVGHGAEVATQFKAIRFLLDRTRRRHYIHWLHTGRTKIVVAVRDEDHMVHVRQLAQRRKIPTRIIRDAGKTEIQRGTITVLALGPYRSEDLDLVAGDLRRVNIWPHPDWQHPDWSRLPVVEVSSLEEDASEPIVRDSPDAPTDIEHKIGRQEKYLLWAYFSCIGLGLYWVYHSGKGKKLGARFSDFTTTQFPHL